MFERITFRRNTTDYSNRVDLGQLAETLLFYGNTKLLIDPNTLSDLLARLGPNTLQRLITMDAVDPIFIREMPAVMTRAPILEYDIINMEVVGHDERQSNEYEHVILNYFERSLGPSLSTNRAAERFTGIVHPLSSETWLPAGSNVPSMSRQDVLDPQFLTAAFRVALDRRYPESSSTHNIAARAIETSNGFAIDTDIDFSAYPELSNVAPLLADMAEARMAIQLAAHFDSDVIATPTTYGIIEHKLQGLISSILSNNDEINLFQRYTVGSVGAVAETINSGERTFEEFLELLGEANEFRNWVVDREPSEELLEHYMTSLTSISWMDRIGTKSARFVGFTGAGIVADLAIAGGLGTLAGLTVSAVDTFLLDRVISGWTPNQFVDDKLRPFTSYE